MGTFIFQAIPIGASLFALAASAAVDLQARIIPNKYAVLLAASGIALGLGADASHLWISLLAALAVFVALGVFAHYGVMGGGDVKLIGAAALLVSPDRIPLLLAEIALAGGIVSLFYLAIGFALKSKPRLRPRASKDRSPFRKWVRREASRIARGYPVPYALAVLGGVTIHYVRELPKCLDAISCSL